MILKKKACDAIICQICLMCVCVKTWQFRVEYKKTYKLLLIIPKMVYCIIILYYIYTLGETFSQCVKCLKSVNGCYVER